MLALVAAGRGPAQNAGETAKLVESAEQGDAESQRHQAIVLRLEFPQHQQKRPAPAQAEMPDGVAVARAQLVADVLGRELAQAEETDEGTEDAET